MRRPCPAARTSRSVLVDAVASVVPMWAAKALIEQSGFRSMKFRQRNCGTVMPPPSCRRIAARMAPITSGMTSIRSPAHARTSSVVPRCAVEAGFLIIEIE